MSFFSPLVIEWEREREKFFYSIKLFKDDDDDSSREKKKINVWLQTSVMLKAFSSHSFSWQSSFFKTTISMSRHFPFSTFFFLYLILLIRTIFSLDVLLSTWGKKPFFDVYLSHRIFKESQFLFFSSRKVSLLRKRTKKKQLSDGNSLRISNANKSFCS